MGARGLPLTPLTKAPFGGFDALRAGLCFWLRLALLLYGTWFQTLLRLRRGLFLAKVIYLLYGVLTQTLLRLRRGPLSAGRKGEKTTKGANPLWEPLRANKQRLAAAQAKEQACLRNRSLVVPDKVPPADLYVEPQVEG